MSEQDRLQHNITEDPAGSSQQQGHDFLSPGTLLRQGREAAGVGLLRLAASLKVPVEKIEALEQDQFHLLPDAVFVRALAGSVCRMLKLDPAPILERLPAIHAAKPTPQNRGINKSFRPRNVSLSGSAWSSIYHPAAFAGIALLLGALILVFLPTVRQYDLFAIPASTDAPPDDGEILALPVSMNGTTEVADGVNAAPSNAVPVDTEPPRSAVVLNSASASTVVPAPASAAAIAGTSADISSVDSSAGLTFRATGQSWIKVVDAKGQVALNRTLQAGEVANVLGVFPFSVTVGRTDVTQIQVRGQAFDLIAVSKNNIARFEVK